MEAKVTHSCQTLCDPMDCIVQGIAQQHKGDCAVGRTGVSGQTDLGSNVDCVSRSGHVPSSQGLQW